MLDDATERGLCRDERHANVALGVRRQRDLELRLHRGLLGAADTALAGRLVLRAERHRWLCYEREHEAGDQDHFFSSTAIERPWS